MTTQGGARRIYDWHRAQYRRLRGLARRQTPGSTIHATLMRDAQQELELARKWRRVWAHRSTTSR